MLITGTVLAGLVMAEEPTAGSPAYVSPIEDMVIPTPAPKNLVWAHSKNTFPCIGKVNNGYLIVYTDTQGIKRAGLLPYRTRMKSQTADESDGVVTICPSVSIEIAQGGILLVKNSPYRLIGEVNGQQKVLFINDSFTQEVSVAKAKMQPASIPSSSTNNAPSTSEKEILTPKTNLNTNKTASLSITTVSGVTYSDCTISRVEPDGISIFCSKGIVKLPFTELQESYREKYGYDPKKAELYIQQKNQAIQLRNLNQNDSEYEISSAIKYSGKVLQVIDSGALLISRSAYYSQSRYAAREPIFVAGLSSGIVDGGSWSGWLVPNGIFQYLSKDGIQQTVKSYRLPSASALTALEDEARRKGAIEARMESQVRGAEGRARY